MRICFCEKVKEMFVEMWWIEKMEKIKLNCGEDYEIEKAMN